MSVLVTIKINWRFKSFKRFDFFTASALIMFRFDHVPLWSCSALIMFGFDHVRLWSCSSFSTNKIELTLRTRSWVRLVKWQLAAEITSFFNVESELRNERIYELAFTKKCKFLMFGLCSGIPLWGHINIFCPNTWNVQVVMYKTISFKTCPNLLSF